MLTYLLTFDCTSPSAPFNVCHGYKQELLADVKARGKKQIYIFKPDAGCQGRGIRLCQGGKEEAVVKLLKEMEQQPNLVAQHYLAKPLLVNGFKFDMRIYALVSVSCVQHAAICSYCQTVHALLHQGQQKMASAANIRGAT
jgi:hypothetical protein